jgi:Fic family protein
MNSLLSYIKEEKQIKRKGGLYHKTQVNFAYNSNRIEGSKLTEDQTRCIFETRTIGFKDQEAVPVDDITVLLSRTKRVCKRKRLFD